MIIIGLGTGRSGTASLAKLLNAQSDAICFHEMNPSCMRWEGTPRPAVNMVEEFGAILDGGPTQRLTVDLSRPPAAEAYEQLKKMPRARMLGDIAFYYLTYVDDLLAASDRVRFICLKRDRTQTVTSWMTKSGLPRWPSKAIGERISAAITREPYHDSRNFWMEHDGTKWALDPVWDKLYPKFTGPTKREAVEQYWDFYYAEAEKIEARLPKVFRIVRTEDLDDRDFQSELLTFCGVSDSDKVHTDAHIHKSKLAS
ncbi:MAG: sulfotransferase [Pseudomonadota bacterium]